MLNLREILAEVKRPSGFLLAFTLREQNSGAAFSGEAFFGLGASLAGLDLEWLNLRGLSTRVGEVETGEIGLVTSKGGASFTNRENSWEVEAAFSSQVLYAKIIDELGLTQRGDIFNPETETFTGSIRLQCREQLRGRDMAALLIEAGSLEVSYVAGGLGRLEALSFSLQGFSLRLTAYPLRALTLRPVFVHDGSTAQKDQIRAAWNSQISTAKTFWRRCCVVLDDRIPFSIADGARATETTVNGIGLALSNREVDSVEVFVVAGPVDNGGGQTKCGGQTQAESAISAEKSQSSPFLLTHEIGHVLGGVHPGELMRSAVQWEGQVGTILDEPDDFGQNPKLPEGTCKKVNCNALVSGGGTATCQFQPIT